MEILSQATTKTVASFSIRYLQYLDANYQPTQTFPEFATPETLLKLYRKMALTRALDNKAVNLQRTGQIGTYPSAQGQEAIGIGIGFAMQSDDVLCPNYRDQATMILRTSKLVDILSYWGGDERGSYLENNSDDLPICVPIAGQCLHATGIAFAIKHRQQQRVVVTTIGDGGSSKGDFYEAMNLAGVWNLPVVFVVNNNQWSISVPREKQTATQTIAQKAIAAGFEGLQVDGNDVIAVTDAVDAAIKKARSGCGPTLIEALTFRLCDHTTADDATRYMPAEERKQAWKEEPIARLGFYLEAQGLWSREKEAELQKELTTEVENAVKEYLALTPQKPQDLFDYLYEEVPEPLLDQYDSIGTNV